MKLRQRLQIYVRAETLMKESEIPKSKFQNFLSSQAVYWTDFFFFYRFLWWNSKFQSSKSEISLFPTDFLSKEYRYYEGISDEGIDSFSESDSDLLRHHWSAFCSWKNHGLNVDGAKSIWELETVFSRMNLKKIFGKTKNDHAAQIAGDKILDRRNPQLNWIILRCLRALWITIFIKSFLQL